MNRQARKYLPTHRPADIAGKRAADLPDGVTHVEKEAAAVVEQAGDRTFKFVVSTAAVDHDVLRQDGWQLDAFKRNPVILLEHGTIPALGRLPIGRASSIGVDDGALKSSVVFEDADVPVVGPYAEMAVRMCRSGTLRATSVGFRPLRWSVPKGEQARGTEWAPGVDFEQMELLEISVVGIPANAEALITARSLRRSAPRALSEARTLPTRAKMPTPPAYGLRPAVHMHKAEMRAEREELEQWMVRVAALPLNGAELRTYDEVKYLADELYCLEAMSR